MACNRTLYSACNAYRGGPPIEWIKLKNMKMTMGAALAAGVFLALSVAGPASSQELSPSISAEAEAAEISTLIESDPEARYVSVAEAAEQFGFDPNESAESTESTESTESVISPYSSWWGCDYEGRADYPHVTNGEASVHGYWVKTGGSCPATATVTVNLQALRCSAAGCTWVTQATDFGKFVSGSGTGKWATPHKACANSNLVGWRGEVDVNLTDFADPFGYHYGTAKDLSCSPA